MVLQEPDRLTEDGPADAVPGDQLDLAAEQLARLPPLTHNRLRDLVSDYLCLLQGDVSLLTGWHRPTTAPVGPQQGPNHTLTGQFAL
jgi:hypothetical protein